MSEDKISEFSSIFDQIKEPRVIGRVDHPLTEVLFLIISGSICGAESWRDFVTFAKEKMTRLETALQPKSNMILPLSPPDLNIRYHCSLLFNQ